MFKAVALALAFLTLAVCAFALIRGRTPERLTAGIVLASVPLGILVRTVPPPDLITTVELVVDGLIAFAMLALTLRYASAWLGLVMLLYAGQFAMHAFFLVSGVQSGALHSIINNGIFFAIIASLFAGTLASQGRIPRRGPEASAAN